MEKLKKKEERNYLVEAFGDQIHCKLVADAVYPDDILFSDGFREEGSQPGRHVIHLLQQQWGGKGLGGAGCSQCEWTLGNSLRQQMAGFLSPSTFIGDFGCQVQCSAPKAFTRPFPPGWTKRREVMATDESNETHKKVCLMLRNAMVLSKSLPLPTA